MSQRRSDHERVVLTGMGAVTDLGPTASATWAGMREGRSGISAIDLEFIAKHTGWTVTIAGIIRGLDTSVAIDPRESRRLDRSTQLCMVAAHEAWTQSGLSTDKGDRERMGVVIGSGVGGIITIEEGTTLLNERGPTRLSPFTVPKLMLNASTGNLSIRYNLQGRASAHATACASSGHAMLDAAEIIRRGHADVMLAGGCEAAVSGVCIASFSTMKALSTRNAEPTKASRPFDKDRDGFVLAEGAGVVVLESLAHARARGAEILAELVGGANSSDAYHITAPDAQGRGAARSMRWALQDAQLQAEQIDYINAHGTSTPLGDKAEVEAVLTLFGTHARRSAGGKLMMSSTKSVHGHCLGASGAVETVACVEAVRQGIVPPTINLDQPDDGFDMDLVPHTARQAPVRYAMNNTFGFGGHNVTMIFGRFNG